MEWKNRDNHFAFILFTLIIFFGVSQTVLILNYMDVPKISEQRDFIFGVSNYYYRVNQVFNWDISFNDSVISNIENIIILILMLWGFMRLFDLLRFLVNYK